MAWVQSCGIQFNATTYEELIAVTEIAEVGGSNPCNLYRGSLGWVLMRNPTILNTLN